MNKPEKTAPEDLEKCWIRKGTLSQWFTNNLSQHENVSFDISSVRWF